jgi:hypothetical protein
LQTFPQPPQFSTSKNVSTQAGPQRVVPPAHEEPQLPLVHPCSAPQTVVHPPQ